MFKYLKYYLETDSKMLRKMAHESAKEYFANKNYPEYWRLANEANAYQVAFRRSYRIAYAKAKLKEGVV